MPLPEKHPQLHVYSQEPPVAGPPLALLRQNALTPTDRFFVRSHGATPAIDPQTYRLDVLGLVRNPGRFSLAELRGRFPRASLTATLQCAGNRRAELIAFAPTPGEIPWGPEAVSNAVWGGYRLRDVLAAAGVGEADGRHVADIAERHVADIAERHVADIAERHVADIAERHVAFTGLDAVTRHGHTFGFGGSIPLLKALSAEVLLADEMNGAPLPSIHGYPLRVVVPGYIGARSVKWLGAITVQESPSDNYFQARAYRLFAPDVRAEAVNWDEGLMLGEHSLNAVICEPEAGSWLRPGSVRVAGYALAGGSRRVARVEVSGDGGSSWRRADLQTGQRWTWQFWELTLELPPGETELVARAWDSAANSQPEEVRSVWNFKGYLNNAWHRVKVQVEG